MTRLGRVPVVLVTGVDAEAMAATTIALQWDLPRTVVLRHDLDVAGQQLQRVVSDASGELERVVHHLEHVCVSCALREDVVPTMERLAADGRWDTVVVHLPVAAEPVQVCRVLERDPTAAPSVTVAAVVAALAGGSTVEDLLGDDLLHERGLHTADDDERGVAETCTSLVEYADVVVAGEACGAEGLALLRMLVRPGAELVGDPTLLDGPALLAGRHDHGRTEAWVSSTRGVVVPLVVTRHAWTLELTSERPFSPQRLLQDIESLGTEGIRLRGCFWLPTRPGTVGELEGAGGQLSIGSGARWGHRTPVTNLVAVGAAASRDRIDQLRTAFARTLLDDAEVAARGLLWEAFDDGLEPWLGPVPRAAA